MEKQDVTFVIPYSRYREFKRVNPGMRWGQEFYNFMHFEKITSSVNKAWCDRLYQADYSQAHAMVNSVLDFTQ